MNLQESARISAERWLMEPSVDEETKKTIRTMLDNSDPKLLIDSFYQSLEFGTGGLRGIMGVGSNCINKYTIGAATQGLSNYLKQSFAEAQIKVAIAYDSRNNSKELAKITADVFSANGIHVYLFSELRPTPLLSFAIRHLSCHAGVVVTASHNPKEYNGYKAYWSDGAQLVPPHDKNVMAEVTRITSFDQVKFESKPELIVAIGKEVEDAYYEQVKKLIPAKDSISRCSNISIVYSAIHGSGGTMVPECLKRIGFTNYQVVDQQQKPDGNFPTVASPNPEEKSAMALALALATEKHAELVMATDPDADRVGIAIKNNKGEFFLLNGNQAFALMIWFILKNLEKSDKNYIAKTIVTTELIDSMAVAFGIKCINTLTGFKYIAEIIKKFEGSKKFIAAGEESYGYMVGDFVRDKDAVSACAFFAAMAASAKDQGDTLYSWLLEIYRTYGFYKEGLVNLVRKGADGAQQIKSMMNDFRSSAPALLGGEKVVKVMDYKKSIEFELASGTTKQIDLPSSDVLQFFTEKGTKVSVRPSGTEPKIKFYISVNAELPDLADFEKVNDTLDKKIKAIETQLTG